MPEGPECHTISKRLGRILKDKKILSIEIHGGRYKKHGNPYGFDEFIKNIKNCAVESVKVKGKLIYLCFSNDFVLLNTLGMSGSWRLKESKHCDVSIQYGTGEKIWFKDQRHFGTLKFIRKSELENKLNKIGPDVLSSEFTEEFWYELCLKYQEWTFPKLLMNQSKISGIGNYLKCEILYASAVSPHIKIGETPVCKVQSIFENSRIISLSSLRAKGVSIRDYQLPDASNGSFQFKLKVYNKKQDYHGYKVIKELTDDKRTTHWVREIQN